MTFSKLSPEVLRKHKGKSFTGITTVFFCHDGQGNLLMAKRSQNARDEQGTWEPGAGGLKFGIAAKDNVRREIMEEYGTEPMSIQFLGYRDMFRNIDNDDTHWVALDFVVELDRSKVINNEPEAIDELGWFTLDNLPQPLHSQMVYALDTIGDDLRSHMSTRDEALR